jgi:hypothetical protein
MDVRAKLCRHRQFNKHNKEIYNSRDAKLIVLNNKVMSAVYPDVN